MKANIKNKTVWDVWQVQKKRQKEKGLETAHKLRNEI